jgi:hypothetical protein
MMDDLITLVAKYCELRTLLNLRMVNKQIKTAVDGGRLNHPSFKLTYPVSFFFKLGSCIYHDPSDGPVIKISDIKNLFLLFGVQEEKATQYLHSLHGDSQLRPLYLRKNLIFFHAEKLRSGQDPVKLGKVAYALALVNELTNRDNFVNNPIQGMI